jgi:hypothetical protein
MPPPRSAFIDCQTGEPIPIPDSAIPGRKWYVVRLLPEEGRFEDEELINLTIQRLRDGQYNVEDTPDSQWMGLRIAYQVSGNGRNNDLDMALTVARNWKEDIIRGYVCIDLGFVFGERPSRPVVRYIDI